MNAVQPRKRADHLYLEQSRLSYGCLHPHRHWGRILRKTVHRNVNSYECTSMGPVHSGVFLTATIAHNDLMNFDRLFRCGAARLYRTFHDLLIEFL